MNSLYLVELIEQIEREGVHIDPNVDYKRLEGRKYEFRVGRFIYNLEYIVNLTKDNQRIFEFKFMLMNNPKSPKRVDFKTDMQYNIALQKSKIGITGTGEAKKVFDKVISIIVKILEEESPEYVNFQSNEENRGRLYLILIKNVLNQIHKYKLINNNPITNEINPRGDFWLKKKH